MEEKGLCRTCDKIKGCVFVNGPSVWQCEEFDAGRSFLVKPGRLSPKRSFTVSQAVEGE